MKKLLVLTLVLGLASAASAVVISVDTDTVTPGGTATFSFTADNANNYSAWFEVGLTGSGTSAFGPMELTANAPIGEGDTWVQDPSVTGYAGFWQFFVISTNPGNQPKAGVQGTMVFTGGVAGDTGSLTLWDAGGIAAVDAPVTVTVVPEPMTLGLLGLGGLFLRRRK